MELKKGDYLIVKLDTFIDIGSPEWIVGVKTHSDKFKLIKNDTVTEITNYKDYYMGILFDLDEFIPSGTTLRIYPLKHHSCEPGCSSYFRPKKTCKYYNILPKKYSRFQRKDRRTTTSESKKMELLVQIKKIDLEKKFIDLSIGKCYKLSSKCK